jgi:hypothetical protein
MEVRISVFIYYSNVNVRFRLIIYLIIHLGCVC